MLSAKYQPPCYHALLLLFVLGAAASPMSTSWSIDWSNCSTLDPSLPPTLECGQLQVPLDWNNLQGESIPIGLVRLPSKNENKLGSLIYNPGGPGGAASTIVAAQAAGVTAFSDALLENFDIVGMDPRGVGQLGAQVKCDPKLWNERTSIFPKNEDEFETMVARNKALWESCANMTGSLLFHIDTISVVKDLDAVRIALGDDKLNFLGASYGSQIGQTYAQHFPDRYRALALDGIVDHSQSEIDAFVTEATTYDRTFGRFADWCEKKDSDCALQGQDVKAVFSKLIDEATTTPIPAPGCDDKSCRSKVSEEDILFVVQTGLHYVPTIEVLSPGWTGLAAALVEAIQGNATLLSTQNPLAQSESDAQFAGLAISCLDWTWDVESFSDLKYKIELGAYVAPTTRGFCQLYQGQTQCLGFPQKPSNPQGDMMVKNQDMPPILLAQSKHDPSTSFVWAENVRNQIEENAFVLRDGDGHTSYFLFGETSRTIDAYLVNGTLPDDNLVVKT